jgi:hypothetical protein
MHVHLALGKTLRQERRDHITRHSQVLEAYKLRSLRQHQFVQITQLPLRCLRISVRYQPPPEVERKQRSPRGPALPARVPRGGLKTAGPLLPAHDQRE